MKALDTITNTGYADLIDYAVVDQANDSVGTLHSLWSDQNTGGLEFLGVKTGWLFGSNHVVPTANAQVDEAARTIQVPYRLDLIKNAPAVAADAEITEEQEAEIYRYYQQGDNAASRTTEAHHAHGGGVGRTAAGLASAAVAAVTPAHHEATDAPAATHREYTATAPLLTADTSTKTRDAKAGETIEVPLSEEQLKVGKRNVETGAVRLRKIIRTEVVNTPVELRREDVVVERIAAKDMRPGDMKAADFNEKNIDITLHREEAVVGKETVVTGAVRLNKTVETETQTVSDTVRKEDVEVDKSGVKTATTDAHRDDTLPRR